MRLQDLSVYGTGRRFTKRTNSVLICTLAVEHRCRLDEILPRALDNSISYLVGLPK